MHIANCFLLLLLFKVRHVSAVVECKIDVGIIIDDSTSIDNGGESYDQIRYFLNKVVEDLDANSGDSRFAMNRFSTYAPAEIEFNLNTYLGPTRLNDLKTHIDNMKFEGGNTNTASGLISMLGQFSPEKGDRSNVRDVFIVCTDGNPNLDLDLLEGAVDQIHARNITIIAVGVGSKLNEYNLKSLLKISDDHFLKVADYSKLDEILDRLKEIVCEIPVCALCKWAWGTGYRHVRTDCREYFMCLRTTDPEDPYIQFQRPCGRGTYWNQEALTCDREIPSNKYCSFVGINDREVPKAKVCENTAGPNDHSYYYRNELSNCPAHTKYFDDKCACLIVDPVQCDDLILWVTFDGNLQDHSCHKAFGDLQGRIEFSQDAKQGTESGYFDGFSFLEFAFLANYLTGKNVQNWSICLWFKSANIGDGYQGLIAQADCNTDPSYEIFLGKNLNIHGFITSESGIGLTNYAFVENEWTHVCLTYNGQWTTMYVNSVSVSSSIFAQGSIRGNQCPLVLGFRAKVINAHVFTGYMDDLRIYEKTLSQAQIDTLYNTP